MKYNNEYWNSISNSINKHHYNGEMHTYKKIAYNKILDKINKQNKKILVTDLFDDAYTQQMAWELESNYYAIDISDRIINKVPVEKQIYKTCADIRNLPYKEESFDIVFNPSTCDHFPKSELVKSMEEMKRVLKKKGFLIITLNNRLHKWRTWQILKLCIPYDIYSYDVREACQIIIDSGLKIQHSKTIFHMPAPYVLSRFINLLRYSKFTGKEYYERIENKNDNIKTGELIAIIAKKI
jgi:SAM-dependent methyltransferase